MRTWGKRIVLAALFLLVGAQFVPMSRTNPAVLPARAIFATMPMPPEIATVLRRACQDCHSNQTAWPWYSRVAPVSWLIARDVSRGRRELNLSEWGGYAVRRQNRKLQEICEQVTKSEMPMTAYTLIHRQARLSDQDKKGLCGWTDTARKSLARVPAAPPAAG